MTRFDNLFRAPEDPRASNARRHSLRDILAIASGAIHCGGQTGGDMELSDMPSWNCCNPS